VASCDDTCVIASINPATGETLATFTPLSGTQIEEKLELAMRAFRSWRGSSFPVRAALMERVAAILEADKDSLGRLITLEMGKPVRAAKEEVLKCAWACRYYAGNAEKFLRDEPVLTTASRSYVHYQPIGVVLAIMPWNFPFWQVFRFAAPALMAGNVCLLKHASNVPQCSMAIEDVFRRSGFPEGIFQSLLVGARQASGLIEDQRIAGVTVTGSVQAGSAVAAASGRQIKKTVLELGGSDAFIVMPSADLGVAVQTAVRARMINNGQSCIAAKRFLVAKPCVEEFTRRFVEAVRSLKVGDPIEEDTDVGPLATLDGLRALEQQIQNTLAMGARLLTGGRKIEGPGYYFEPTVLADVSKNSPASRDEIFGPVAAVFSVKDATEAIHVANETDFGLGASVWTNDEQERVRFIEHVDAGMVFVNGMVVSDPRLPFGGVKRSGYGRELGRAGILEFTNVKTVWIA